MLRDTDEAYKKHLAKGTDGWWIEGQEYRGLFTTKRAALQAAQSRGEQLVRVYKGRVSRGRTFLPKDYYNVIVANKLCPLCKQPIDYCYCDGNWSEALHKDYPTSLRS